MRDASLARGKLLAHLSLFSSVGTLVCCALPSLLVLAGLGTTMASVLSTVPWLVTLSRHKDMVFSLSSLLILGNAYYAFRVAPKLQSGCPPDEKAACAAATRFSRVVLVVSGGLYLVGVSVAYGLGPVLAALE